MDLKKTKTRPQPTFSTGLRRQYVFEPVAVGTPLNEAPLQTTELLNVGEAAVSYKVDSHGIKRANSSQGHGMPVRFIVRSFRECLAPNTYFSRSMRLQATTSSGVA